MSKKNLLIVAALLVIIAVFVQLYSKKSKRSGDSPVGDVLASAELADTSDEIVIEKNKTAIHLKKNGDEWVITEKNDFPVDTQKLISLLEIVTSSRIAALVSKDKSRLAHFNLLTKTEPGNDDETTGTTLAFKSKGKTLFSMVAGRNRDSASTNSKRPSRPDGTYIRMGLKEVVYLVKENLSFETNADEWMRTVLLSVDEVQVKSVRFESPVSRFLLTREDSKAPLKPADISGSEQTDTETVERILEELKSFKIENAYLKNSAREDDLKLNSEIAVTAFDGSHFNFQILVKTEKSGLTKGDDKEKKTYFAKVLTAASNAKASDWQLIDNLGKRWLFKLDSWQAETWLKTRKDFLKSKAKP